MTKKKSVKDLDFESVIARAALHEQLKNTPDVLLGHDQTAFFMGLHPKKLARWRHEKRPPHPMAMNAEGQSGVQVLYRVGELLDFIRQSQTQPEPTAVSSLVSHQVVNGKRQKPSSMAWATADTFEVETLEEPFFMTTDGLVSSHCWDEDVTAIAERLASRKNSIRWMVWDEALAAVWQDDRLRLAWLCHADSVAPTLRAAVKNLRDQALTRI